MMKTMFHFVSYSTIFKLELTFVSNLNPFFLMHLRSKDILISSNIHIF
jgi:hypothetical protein